MKLEKENIVAEAIALLNEEGLDNVSLRKLARRLSVQAPSLAWHVKNKNTLLALMSLSIFQSCFAAIPTCEDKYEWLMAFGRAVWEAQNNTRDAARLIAEADLDKEVQMDLDVVMHAALKKVGLDTSEGYQMQFSIQALATGWCVFRKSPSEPHIEESFSIEEGYFNSLRALMEGWKAVGERSTKDGFLSDNR